MTSVQRHCLDVPLEPIENCLPALSLLFPGKGRLRVERLADENAAVLADEFDDRDAIGKSELDEFAGNDLRVIPSEIETRAAVLGFHPRRERSAIARVDGSGGGMPVIGRRHSIA